MTQPVQPNRDLPVALDAMGGDVGLSVNVEGAVVAVREDGANVVLVGDEPAVKAEVERIGASGLLGNGLAVRHAPEVVLMDEKPAVAVRQKKASSMRVTCDLVKSGDACAALSAGNSGAMMAMALFVLKRIRGVIRPCIASPFPASNKHNIALLVDAGANTDCTPEQLLQFGVMAEAYLAHMFKWENAPVGLVSNGHEDTKGTDLTRGAKILLDQSGLNFVGYVEAKDVVQEKIGVIVTDGFTGNVMLKTAETTAKFVGEQIKAAYMSGGVLTKLGGLLSRSMFNEMRARFDYREIGAAPLLGLGAPAFIAHGSSDVYAMRRAVSAARTYADQEVTAHISDAIAATLQLLENAAPAEAAG